MKSHERAAMTPLEMAVWGAAFASRTNVNLKDAQLVREAIMAADFAVALVRAGIEAERQQEALLDAKAQHRTQTVTIGGLTLLRCTCGFQPRATDTADIEEIMTIHLTMMRALAPEDLKEQK